MGTFDVSGFFTNFVLNLFCVTIFCIVLYYNKYKDKHSAITFLLFNIFLFILVYVLKDIETSISVGFAIFGLISIVRLRSDTFSKIDIAYFTGVMVIAIVNALMISDIKIAILINLLLLLVSGLVVYVLAPQLQIQNCTVQLDTIPEGILTNKTIAKQTIGSILSMDILDFDVHDIDRVKGSTKITIYFVH